MTAVEGELSLFDNPVGFVDHLASLEEQGLSAAQRRELLELVTAQYHRADYLLKPLSFVTRIRPYNGRPSGFFKNLDYSDDVNIEEAYLLGFGRVQIDIKSGGNMGFQLIPENKDTHQIRASFHGSLEDRTHLTRFFVKDTYVDLDEDGKVILVRRGYALETTPLRFRPLAENESF